MVEQIIGDPLEFDDEEWIAATKQARANYRQERAVKTFMGDHKYGGGGDGYMYKSGEVSTQLNLPTYGIVTKFEPELIRTLTRLEFVRKDLELSRDQMVQLERSISEFQEMWKKHIKDRGSPDFASRNAKFKIEIENNEMGLQAIFDEKQRARVFQILNQMSHRAFSHQPVLTHPAWPSSLKLSKERTAKFREEVESVKTARAKIIEEQEKSLGKIYARFEKKMKSEFDESDRKKMDELLGDPVFLPTWEDRTNSDAEKAGTEDADKR